MRQRGFTLLEVLVATLIMAIAIAGLMSALNTSLRSAARLTDYDRAALLARQKMDELLIAERLPRGTVFEGTWGREVTGGEEIGWQARLTPFEMPKGSGPGIPFLERIELQIFWKSGGQTRKFTLEGFRREVLTAGDIGVGP